MSEPMPKLLPCPFCGKAAKWFGVNLIGCTDQVDCGANVDSGDSGARTKEFTLRAWQRRAMSRTAALEGLGEAKLIEVRAVLSDWLTLAERSIEQFGVEPHEEERAILVRAKAALARPAPEVTLPFVVEYRRKEDGIRWEPMAAFDVEGVAERYAADCSKTETPWEYRITRRGGRNG